MQHYLQYWKPESAAVSFSRSARKLRYAASNQYKSVQKGDVLWIVTANDDKHLVLIGRILVDEVAGRSRASALLGTSDLYPKEYYAIADQSRAEPMRRIDLTPIVRDLEFKSKRVRLEVGINGDVKAQQLQSIRKLSPASARLIESLWR